MQRTNLQTDQLKIDNDGFQLGASIEAGFPYNLSQTLTLEPGFEINYTQIKWGKFKDKYGKEAHYDNLYHSELEASLKLSRFLNLGNGRNGTIYLKPSLLQNLTNNAEVRITGLPKATGYHDQLLGRVELGGHYLSSIDTQASSMAY